ncbi:dipeptidyl-peptidase 3 family protein [Pseudoalteromonas denitrificans]|uniref:Dipeptidyl-peptidase-3 n=1 Tax=Pseudoalteromonas denitrificans DSM 6059 TaxID=1123010 RepID=A0A1I1MXL6_9GAMM|nr:dihydrofolate reductase [Pseudoalteromonas denitrificans]SFC87998.1 dipeptidyl-peptidase-3 [Pseudoalteromonas denitrificans DSM 6059]
MKFSKIAAALSFALALGACSEQETTKNSATEQAKSAHEHGHSHATSADKPKDSASKSEEFQWIAERFADIRVLRYQVPGFEELPLETKELLFYLYKAALSGRDITWDQNYKYNLTIRHTLEAINADYSGDRNTEEFKKFITYSKQVWFANGIHHHYMAGKIMPEFSFESLTEYVNNVATSQKLPVTEQQNPAQLLALLKPVMFDANIAPKMVDQSAGIDNVKASSVNFYENVTEEEVIAYYKNKKNVDDKRPVSWGLNSKLVKKDGKLIEQTWKVGGMYDKAISQIVHWLDKAASVAENKQQAKALTLLAKYYRSGDLKDFDEYSIAWVKDINSDVDVVNGFIEVYDDPLAYRGSFESVVSVKDHEATKVIAAIASQAQWFEDNSPLIEAHKKKEVKGITGKAITVVIESGDASPSTPIGINLPNANWIRAEHGSKSVSLSNIVNAYDNVKGGSLVEFAWDENEIKRAKEFGPLGSHLHTDLHEVIGHASGQINKGVGTPKETLKQYSSALEEGRADLVALYYLMDNKLVDMGIMPSLEVGKATYDQYIRNGMMQQLNRLKLGESIEEAHMRNRQLIASWAFEKGAKDNVIEKRIRDGKTYFVVNDYKKLQTLFGQLLRELQRIKSEGDFDAGQALIENYAVKVDPVIHQEVLARYEKLNLAPYSGFINPKLDAVYKEGKIIDVTISYPTEFTKQMLEYGTDYGLLPTIN